MFSRGWATRASITLSCPRHPRPSCTTTLWRIELPSTNRCGKEFRRPKPFWRKPGRRYRYSRSARGTTATPSSSCADEPRLVELSLREATSVHRIAQVKGATTLPSERFVERREPPSQTAFGPCPPGTASSNSSPTPVPPPSPAQGRPDDDADGMAPCSALRPPGETPAYGSTATSKHQTVGGSDQLRSPASVRDLAQLHRAKLAATDSIAWQIVGLASAKK